MATVNLTAQKREVLRNSITKSNRKKGIIPGIFYFKNSPSIPISVKAAALNPFVYTSEVRIINLQIEGDSKSQNCILKDIQFDPVTDKPIHFDLLGISENEKITIEVPVKLIGSPVGVRDGGIIQHILYSLEVECLPAHIPAHIDVDISNLGIGDSVVIEDLKIENVQIFGAKDATVVAVVPPAVESKETPSTETETSETEPEVISKGKKEEDQEESK